MADVCVMRENCGKLRDRRIKEGKKSNVKEEVQRWCVPWGNGSIHADHFEI